MTSVTRATAADARVASYRSAYLYAGLSNLIFYVPVLLLYFRALGVSAADSFALVSIYAFVLALTDLPTGVLADALGPRATLIASSLVGIAGALALGLGSSFALLATGETLVALGLSLRSGAQPAYVYELAGATRYREAESTVTALSYVGLALSASLAGTLFSLQPALVFVATAGALLASVLTIPAGQSVRAHDALRPGVATVVARVLRRIRHDPVLVAVGVLFGAFTTITGLAYWAYQLYLDAIGVPIGVIGPAYAASFLASAAGARYAARANQRFGAANVLLVQGVVLVGCVAAMSSVRHPVGIVLLPLVQVTTGYLFPTFYALLQDRVSDGERATLLSLEGVLQRGALALALLGFGAIVSASSLGDALRVTAAAGVIVVIATPLTIRRIARATTVTV